MAHFDDDTFGIYWNGPQLGAVPVGLDGIYGRQFNSAGVPKGPDEILVDTSDKYSNIGPGAARADAARFVVTWREYNTSDQPDDTLFLRIVDDTEHALNDPQEFADGFIARDTDEDVAGLQPDGFVISWTRSVPSSVTAEAAMILIRRFDAAGAAATDEIRVTAQPDNAPVASQIAGLPNGSSVVVWMELFVDTADSDGVLMRRYGADGTPLSDAQIVNTYTTGAQQYPSVASFSDGRFVVVWESTGQDGSDKGVFAQKYDSLAAKIGTEFQVNTYTEDRQRQARVVTEGSSRFSIFWISRGQDGDGFGLFGQHFDWDSGPIGPEFRVNVSTKGDQGWLGHSESSDSAGNLVVAWSGGGTEDIPIDDIFARRFCLADSANSRCGLASGSAAPTATDALAALRAAVGDLECAVCECDSDGNGAITAGDALRILRKAVGNTVELQCPPCCS